MTISSLTALSSVTDILGIGCRATLGFGFSCFVITCSIKKLNELSAFYSGYPVVKVALHIVKVVFFIFSLGTFLATTGASMFPASCSTVLLLGYSLTAQSLPLKVHLLAFVVQLIPAAPALFFYFKCIDYAEG